MKKYAVLLFLLSIPATTVFAQRDRDDDDDWRRSRRYTRHENRFELTPFAGYRWGGTIFADQTFIFREDVDVAPAPNLGVNFALPLGDSNLKLELMANRQSSELQTDDGLFDPNDEVADIDVTYLHAGLQIGFGDSRNVTPYFVVSAGLTNLDPQLRDVSAENRFSASAGFGVKAPISDVLAIKFEGRGYYTALQEEDDCRVCDYFYNDDFYQGEVNLGLVISF